MDPKPDSIQGFLEWGRRQVSQDRRGVLSHLRRGFNPDTEHYCWPFIAPFCNLNSPMDRQIWTLVAAGFATHQTSPPCGNMGMTLRKMALDRATGKPQEALEAFDPRFRRLINGDRSDLCRYLPPLIRMAKAGGGVPIDFECLFNDLKYWGKQTQLRWVQSYWTGDAPSAPKDIQP